MEIDKKRKNLIEKFIEINSQINLSAIRDESGIYVKHILDSLELDKILKFKKGSSVCDVGTGGGFPLLPLAINNPDVKFTGIDSVNKKIKAVGEIISFLDIKNINLFRTRAENFQKQFDYVLIRSVGYVDKLWNRTNHLIKSDGYLILYKIYDKEEYRSILNICIKNKLKIEKKYKYRLFDGDFQRIIYLIKK